MMLKALLMASVAIVLTNAASRDRNNKDYKVVCYLGSWANYRHGDGKFLIEHIDPFICTHLVYGFAKLQGNRIAAYDPYLDLKENWGLGAFRRFNKLKTQNPYLTTILAIGGWNEGSTKYSAMARNPAARKEFVESVVDFLEKYDFDGLDMDWEYPANRGGSPEDKENFIHLLRELKEAFEPKGFILTAAVAAGEATMNTAYDIASMGKYLDIINLMAYDLHGAWESITGHNAPLYARDEETADQKKLNVDHAVDLWIQRGAPPKKIALGMASYGRSFTLVKAENNGLDQPTKGPGSAGPITREPGMLGYNEICLDLKQGWTRVWVPKHEVPYAYKGNQWVGYDDLESIGHKIKYLKDKKLGGGMIWSIETDDFRGKCGDGEFPIITKIQTELNGPINRFTPTVGPTTPAPPPPGTLVPDDWSWYQCFEPGFYRHAGDCTKFYHCDEQPDGKFKHKLYRCAPDLAFDQKSQKCLPRDQVKC